MTRKRIQMGKQDDIRRLKELGYSHREIARILNINKDTVTRYLNGPPPLPEQVIPNWAKERIADNDFVFHVKGRPLNYATIQVNYRKAQQDAKIPYSGTHILRHGMAKLARQIGGGLDAVIAMTGHKDIKLADHYSKSNEDDQKFFSKKIMEHIRIEIDRNARTALENFEENNDLDNVISLFQRKSGT